MRPRGAQPRAGPPVRANILTASQPPLTLSSKNKAVLGVHKKARQPQRESSLETSQVETPRSTGLRYTTATNTAILQHLQASTWAWHADWTGHRRTSQHGVGLLRHLWTRLSRTRDAARSVQRLEAAAPREVGSVPRKQAVPEVEKPCGERVIVYVPHPAQANGSVGLLKHRHPFNEGAIRLDGVE